MDKGVPPNFWVFGEAAWADRLTGGHTIWHLFALAGNLHHYFAVLFFVIPRKA
jgi:predicted membrane channel-forming protein YqfA (hemolysin III family)